MTMRSWCCVGGRSADGMVGNSPSRGSIPACTQATAVSVYRGTMPATTPPKGRPTAGRRDRQVARRRVRSRTTTKKFLYVLLAVLVLAALLVLGTGTGSSTGGLGDPSSNVVLPALLLGRFTRAARLDPRS